MALAAAEPDDKKNAVPAAAQPGKASLRVVDRDGQPVARFEVNVSGPEEIGSDWVAGKDGQASLDAAIRRLPDAESIDVVARAEGFASTVRRFAGSDREKLVKGEAAIELDRGARPRSSFDCRRR